MMVCKKCGNVVEKADAKFCPVCGWAFDDENVSKEGTTQKEKNRINKKLVFEKKKMISYLVYKQTDTEVEIDNENIYCLQTVKKFLRKPRKSEENIKISNIKDIRTKIKMDFWDTLYAIIFVIFGIFAPVFFLVAALFLFCGFGRIIQIEKKDGGKYLIPSGFKTDDVQQLLDVIK